MQSARRKIGCPAIVNRIQVAWVRQKHLNLCVPFARNCMARSRPQGRTPPFPASPPLTARASQGGCRLGRHAWNLHVRLQLEPPWLNRFEFADSFLHHAGKFMLNPASNSGIRDSHRGAVLADPLKTKIQFADQELDFDYDIKYRLSLACDAARETEGDGK